MIQVQKRLRCQHKDIKCNIASQHSHVDKSSNIKYRIDFGCDVLLIKNITDLLINKNKMGRCCDLVVYKKNDEKCHSSIIIETKSKIGLSKKESDDIQKISRIGDQLQCGYHKFKILLNEIESEERGKKFIVIFETDLTEQMSLNKEDISKRNPRKRALNSRDKITIKAWRDNKLLCTDRAKYPYHSSKIQIIKIKHIQGQDILLQNI